MKRNGFDILAPLYDRMAWLVYGKSIRMAQLCFMHKIPDGASVLILGGGTGWFLRALMEQRPACRVLYVDSSVKMIDLARKACGAAVTFVHGTEKSIPADSQFDVVVTHFFLDMFSNDGCRNLVARIKQHLSPDSLWLAADFFDGGKWWHHLLLRLMYAFFRAFCGIEARTLPDWHGALAGGHLRAQNERFFYRGFIRSSAYVASSRR